MTRTVDKPGGTKRSAFVAASWTGQLVSVVCGVALPMVLAPAGYALLFQLRQIHLLGYFTFAFVLQAAVLELGLARGRGAGTAEKPLQHVALGSVLLFSTSAAALVILACRVAVPGMSQLAWIGVLSFSAMLPLLGIVGWANSVLLAMQHFGLLARLVLVHATGVSTGGLIGAALAGLPGAIAGTAAGQVVAALYGMWLCRRSGALGFSLEWALVRRLAAVGVPQSLVALVALASRTLDRNFAYLGYGEGAGGVFGIAATFSLNAFALAAALAEPSRAAINEECGAQGDQALGAHLVGEALRTWLLMLGVAGLGSLCLPLVYPLMFPEYVGIRNDAVVLAALALWAACPVALCFHSHMYLVATRRPVLYLVPYVVCLSIMLGGNAVGLRLGWGLLGIVAVGGASNVALAVLSLALTARHYPALRSGCRRIVMFAVVTGVGAGLLTLALHRAGVWLDARTGIPVPVTLFASAAFILVYAATAWLLERRDGVARPPGSSRVDRGVASTGEMETVSVVIPCRDRPELLRRCLDALTLQRDPGPFEVFVVDTSSGSELEDVIAQHTLAHRVAPAAPLGPGAARNLGAREAHGSILAFIDADCVADPDWLTSARASLDRGARIAGGTILDQRPWSPVAAAGHFMQLAEYGPGRPAGSVPRLCGAQLVMKRSTFEELLGFPSGEGEDIRFTAAAHARWPGRIRFEPEMMIRHASRGEFRAFWERCRQLGSDRAKTGPAPGVIARLGSSSASALVASAARMAYIAGCTARWHPRSVLRFLLFSPIVALGCLRWGSGVRHGYVHTEDLP